MNLKILTKYYKCNHFWNRVYFEVDNVKFEIDICYIYKDRKNIIICDHKFLLLKDYITKHYECDFEDFRKFFLYKLYKYSRGVNLNPIDFVDLSDVKVR